MTDLVVSLVLSGLVSVVVKLWFDDSGLAEFPVLTFLVVSVGSYVLIGALHSFIHW